MIANKLKHGDEVRVIAPSRNLTEVRQDVHHHAIDFWKKEGFNLTFSKNSREVDKFHSSSIASRVEDGRCLDQGRFSPSLCTDERNVSTGYGQNS